MTVLVVGSVAFDSVKTPHGSVQRALGGSASYFSMAAQFFTKVQLVAVVGTDFPKRYTSLFKRKGVDISGLEYQKGKTFQWEGYYEGSMNEAHTLRTDLNVFSTFQPKIPGEFKKTKYLFLANIDPDLQYAVLKQMDRTELVICDTMNYWIQSKRRSLNKLIKKVDVIILNDQEARSLANESNLIKAARIIRSKGPNTVLIKKGEHGAFLYQGKNMIFIPAYPLECVVDPTGAGDSFAGGFVGYLASRSAGFRLNRKDLKQAMLHGTVIASFNVQGFSLNQLRKLKKREYKRRFQGMQNYVNFT